MESTIDASRVEELSLSDVLVPLWDRRFAIAAIAAVSGLLAGGLALSQPARYDATAVVRVLESRSGDTAEPARAENFRPLLENQTIAAGLVKDFSLVEEPRFVWGSRGGPLSPDQFLRNVLAVDQVVGTNLLRVRVRLAEADAAPKVANALIERAIDLNRRINQQEVVEARDYIKSQLDEATARVDRLRGELVTLKQKAQVDALRKDAEGTLHARSGLLELQTAIENERAFLGRSEADLKQSQQLLTTRRTIDRDTALTEAARSQNPGASVLGLGLTDEQINTSYSDLQTQVSESRAKLAGLEGQRRLLVDELRLDRASLPVLAKLYEGDVAVSRLQTEYEMALKVYTDLSVRHEDARIRVGGRGAQLQFVDPAVAPARRVASGLTVSVAIAVLAGALVAGASVLAHRLLARRAHA